MTRNISIASGLIFILLTAAGCGSKAPQPGSSGSAPVEIDVLVIHPDTFSREVLANGSILAGESVILQSEISGRVTELRIREASSVKEGELLVKLYDADLQAQLKKFQSQLELAEKTADRLRQLVAVNGVTAQEYDQALNQVASLQADVEFTRAQIRKTEILAPFSGVIGLREISPGAIVSPGQKLATLQETNRLKVDFTVPESDVALLSGVEEVEVSTTGMEGRAKARIIGREPAADAQTRNIRVRALLEDGNHALYPGAFVTVHLKTASNTNAILIPTHVVIPDSRMKKVALIKSGVVEFREVKTGYRSGEKIEITQGLEPGDSLALNGLLFLKPGGSVRVKNVR